LSRGADLCCRIDDRQEDGMKRNLKRGITGPDVRELQETLNAQGYRLPLTGFFGRQTDEAVRKFQAVRGLVPDGIVGYRTRRALGLDRKPVHPSGSGHSPQPDKGSSHPAGHPSHPVGPPIDPLGNAASFLRNLSDLARRLGCDVVDLLESARKARARERTAPKPAPSRPPAKAPEGKPSQPPAQTPGDDRLQDVKGMHLSKKGKQFIFTHESQASVSNHLHWPRGASGVTLGPGYDMKKRSKSEIRTDMMAIGLDALTSTKISEGSELTGAKADDFANDNYSLVNLTEKQEMKLLDWISPKYERKVKEYIRIPLKQSQFDALVSFAYNPGYEFGTVMELVNNGKIAVAMAEIKKRVKSKGNIVKSLVSRRNYEVNLYLYGDYGKLRKV